MRILAFDSGAIRMGWAVLEGDGKAPPVYIDSGIEKFSKRSPDDADQLYRYHLMQHWSRRAPEMFEEFEVDVVANETLPLVGGANFSNNVQSKLAATAITTVQVMTVLCELQLVQIAAISVKARIGGNKKATKVKVRDGCIRFLPDLAPRKKDWTESKKAMDEPDAIGIALTALGYDGRK